MTKQTETDMANTKSRFWNALQLIMIVIVFSVPVVGAFFYQPQKFGNYGDIYVPVRPVQNLELRSPQGDIELDSLRRQWIFLVVADQVCDEHCERNLLKIRQLRFMQNHDMLRIRTLFLYSDLPTPIAADLLAKYRPMEGYRVAAQALEQWRKTLWIDDAPARRYHHNY